MIKPTDVIRILVPASKVPDGATVCKKGGTREYTLKTKIRVFPSDKNDKRLEIDGLFLVDNSGDINQITATRELLIITEAGAMVSGLLQAWEPTPK